MTTKEFLNLTSDDISKLNKQQAYELANRFKLNTQRRLNVLTGKTQVKDPSLVELSSVNTSNYSIKGFIPTKNMTLNQLRNVIGNQRRLLATKTSTLSGIKEVSLEFRDRLIKTAEGLNIEVDYKDLKEILKDKEKINTYWRMYNKVKKDYQGISYDSHQLQANVLNVLITTDNFEIHNEDELLKYVIKKLDTTKIYEEEKDLSDLDDDGFTWENK